MKYPVFCLFILLISCSSGKQSNHEESKPVKDQPNILLILADDLGYGDIGSYGSEIATPNLDKLAKEGMRLTECYNNGICATSRASILTGQYPHKAGMGFFNVNLGSPAYQGYLNNASLTFGEVFQQAGYETIMAGKWHVGNDSLHWPTQRGFDQFFGFLDGASSYFDTRPIMKPIRNTNFYENNEKYTIDEEKFYLTDELTKKGIEFLEKKESDKPFFLYMAYNAPHWPLHAKDEDISKYEGVYDIGWDSVRMLRHHKQIELGLTNPNQPLPSDLKIPKWSTIPKEAQADWARKMEVYAAMVDNLDQNIGKLISYLKSKNQLDNTLIVFVSDNGADNWDIQKIPVFYPSEGKVGEPGSNESYASNWAQVSNVPLKNYKSTPYEGGLSSPFIARYPGRIPANTTARGFVHFVDFLPSLIQFAGIDYPEAYKGAHTNPLVGQNIVPLLEGDDWKRQSPIYYEWAGHRSIRRDNWKLVSIYPDNQWQLYDLSVDRGETNDLSASNMEVVQALASEFEAWAEVTGVQEWGPEMQERTGFKPPKKKN